MARRFLRPSKMPTTSPSARPATIIQTVSLSERDWRNSSVSSQTSQITPTGMLYFIQFKAFHGKTVRAINVHAQLSKGQHEKMLKFAQDDLGMGGLGYLEVLEDMSYKGPIDKFIPDDMKTELKDMAGLQAGDTIFFIADNEARANECAGKIRNELGARLDLIEKNAFRFCFVNDFPMYEWDTETKKYIFTHNPFSMPQGGLEALNTKKPEEILAYQYDIVCNGIELSSGAVRNHDLDIMKKAFEIAGYSEEEDHEEGFRDRRILRRRAQDKVRRSLQRIPVRRSAARWYGSWR